MTCTPRLLVLAAVAGTSAALFGCFSSSTPGDDAGPTADDATPGLDGSLDAPSLPDADASIAMLDSTTDAPATPETGSEASAEAATEAATEASTDATAEGSLDAAADAGLDAGGTEAGPVDAGPLSVTLGNVRDKGTTSSGFVIGTASGAGLTAVYVSLDAGTTWTAATGTTSWSFRLPTGANTWVRGAAHTIWVYASDGTNQSATTKIAVHTGSNRDINGDGYPDLVVGAPPSLSIPGNVYVFHSQGTSGIASGGAPNTTLTGQTEGFGTSIVLADVNADGYADVIAGDPTVGGTNGAAYVFHSRGSAGIANLAYSAANLTFTGPSGSNFAQSVAAGDLNDDGYADVVVGAPSAGGGAVYVFQSSAAEIASAASTGASVTFLGPGSSRLGISLALGDVNGDGYPDVLAGAWALGSFNGAAYLYDSTGASGLTGVTTASATLSGTTGNGFGYSVALGDVNGDGYADALVGAASGTNTYTGAVYLFQSAGASGVATAPDTSATAKLSGSANSTFGNTIAVGDLNGDGYGDVMVGAINASNAVYVFNGGAASIGTTACSTAGTCAGAATLLSGAATTGFGLSLVATDFDGDGYADLATGAPSAASHYGTVYVFPSAGTTGVPSAPYTSASASLVGTSSSQFGASVD